MDKSTVIREHMWEDVRMYEIFVDVSVDIDPEFARENHVRYVPMEYMIGEEVHHCNEPESFEELHKYYEFMDTSNQSKDITIYWYWNPYISDEEDSNFINNMDVSATIKLNAVQISEYAMMKNGFSANLETYEIITSEFWKENYSSYIKTIKFKHFQTFASR